MIFVSNGTVKQAQSYQQLELDEANRALASTPACRDSSDRCHSSAAVLCIPSLPRSGECKAADSPPQIGDRAVYKYYFRSMGVGASVLFITSSATAVVFTQFRSEYRSNRQTS